MSSRTTPTDSKYVVDAQTDILEGLNILQLCKAASEQLAPEYHGTALAVAFPDGYFLLGTRTSPKFLLGALMLNNCIAREALRHRPGNSIHGRTGRMFRTVSPPVSVPSTPADREALDGIHPNTS